MPGDLSAAPGTVARRLSEFDVFVGHTKVPKRAAQRIVPQEFQINRKRSAASGVRGRTTWISPPVKTGVWGTQASLKRGLIPNGSELIKELGLKSVLILSPQIHLGVESGGTFPC